MTVVHHQTVLSEALSHAVKWELVARNVAQAVDIPSRPDPNDRALNHDERALFMEAASNSIYPPLFYLALHTGMRRSELLGLTWRHTNLDLAQVSVVRVLNRLRDHSVVFEPPKTAHGRRNIDLAPSAALMLRDHRDRQQAIAHDLGVDWTEDWMVFCRPEGSPYGPDNVSSAFGRMARKAGIAGEGVSLKCLRHTHATMLLEQRVHPKVVQERLGHADIGITLDIYSHVTPSMQRDAVQKLERVLP
jgi:integrase